MFRTQKQALLGALNAVRGVVKAGAAIPILANVLFERDGDGLVVTGTNLTIEVRARIPATVEDGFVPFTVAARQVAEFVKSAPDGATIEMEAGTSVGGSLHFVTVKSGRARLKLPVLPAGDFPKLADAAAGAAASLTASAFSRALKAVSYAADTDTDRFYLQGVYLDPGAHGMTLVATDGKVLALRTLPPTEFDDPPEEMPPVIVPNEAVPVLESLTASDETATIAVAPEKIRVEVAGITVVSKLVDGQYPQYRRMVPSGPFVDARVSGKALSAALSRVMLATPDVTRGVGFSLAAGVLRLTARDSAGEEGVDELAIGADGDRETGFNGKFLLRVIDHIGSDDLEMRLGNGAAEPTVIRAAGQERDFSVIMPTQVKLG